MSETFDTYGIDAPSLDEARAAVEAKLGIAFVVHDSDARGGLYFSADLNPGTARLTRNWNSLEQVWSVPDWPRFSVVLEISKPATPDDLLATLTALGDIQHLRREIVPSRRGRQ